VDIKRLYFNRIITGFWYKQWAVENAAVKSNIQVVMKVVLPLIQKLQAHPDAAKYKILLVGHTDGVGPEEPVGDKPGNIAISRMRAEAVLDYIVQNYGLPRDLFEIVPKGGTEPFDKKYLASPLNRRVIISFKP
jgi:flagellar motor protein MotB